jgi:hypothetical protein
MPEVPLPKGPGFTGSVEVYLNMAKNLAKASLEAAFSPASIAAVIPILVALLNLEWVKRRVGLWRRG